MEVGDLIEVVYNHRYAYTRGGQTGIITHIRKDIGSASILWSKESCKQLDIDFGAVWEIEIQYLILKGPYVRLSTEQKVALKCKSLWNNSNWVKANPTRGYT